METGFDMNDETRDELKYSREYEKMHISTLEHKIQEKDRLLIELSSVNQEIYQEMSEMQEKLLISKSERDKLLKENLELKDRLMEKNTVIVQQEGIISKLRYQISEVTNGNSGLVEERSFLNNSARVVFEELKNLQKKYDSREDLIISLQSERVQLLNEIDRLKGFKAGFETFKPTRSLI